MATIKRCDRCLRIFEGSKNEIEASTCGLEGPFANYYDLCDDCMDDFYEFMRGAELKTLAEKLRALLKKD